MSSKYNHLAQLYTIQDMIGGETKTIIYYIIFSIICLGLSIGLFIYHKTIPEKDPKTGRRINENLRAIIFSLGIGLIVLVLGGFLLAFNNYRHSTKN